MAERCILLTRSIKRDTHKRVIVAKDENDISILYEKRKDTYINGDCITSFVDEYWGIGSSPEEAAKKIASYLVHCGKNPTSGFLPGIAYPENRDIDKWVRPIAEQRSKSVFWIAILLALFIAFWIII